MSVTDRYGISLIDDFDQLDAETSESFRWMLGDADFAVVVAQRRAMIDAVTARYDSAGARRAMASEIRAQYRRFSPGSRGPPVQA